MARSTTPQLLSELRSPSSLASQVTALKQLKHDIIGHEQRKRYWVEAGILRHLVRVLNVSKDAKHASPRDAETFEEGTDSNSREHAQEIKLQAIFVLASLAQGAITPIVPHEDGN